MSTYSPRFTEEQIQTLAGLLDVAVKATGLQGAKAVMPILAILEAVEPDPLELTEEAGE